MPRRRRRDEWERPVRLRPKVCWLLRMKRRVRTAASGEKLQPSWSDSGLLLFSRSQPPRRAAPRCFASRHTTCRGSVTMRRKCCVDSHAFRDEGKPRFASHRVSHVLRTTKLSKPSLIDEHQFVREQEHLGEFLPGIQRLGRSFRPAEIVLRVPGCHRGISSGTRRRELNPRRPGKTV